jgi:hypothetical protein
LITKGFDEEDVVDAADILFAKGFNKPSTLIGILSTQLESQGIDTPVAVLVIEEAAMKNARTRSKSMKPVNTAKTR